MDLSPRPYLLQGPLTFGELKSALAGISSNTFTKRIGSLTADGVIQHIPVSSRGRATYAITPHGEAIRDFSDGLDDWLASRFQPAPNAHQTTVGGEQPQPTN